MRWPHHIFRPVFHGISLTLIAAALSACASTPSVPLLQIEARDDAISLPYRLSSAGHIIVDISVNDRAAQPFIIDSGANVSAIYETHAKTLGLMPSETLISVNGIVSSGKRPIVEDSTFQIGTIKFEQDQTVLLDTPLIDNEAVGLLGVDILGGYALVFNADLERVTLLPSAKVTRGTFSGWDRIPLKNRVGTYDDNGLYFAEMDLIGESTPVLIDTGSDLNIINWPLARLDPNIDRLYRKIRTGQRFEGAIDSTLLQTETVFFDVELGTHDWPEVNVMVMEFDIVTTIAPVDQPIMIAGAGMFTSNSFAFDFGGNAIYIQR